MKTDMGYGYGSQQNDNDGTTTATTTTTNNKEFVPESSNSKGIGQKKNGTSATSGQEDNI